MDINTLAKSIVDRVTSDDADSESVPESVATKRGLARAKALTPERRAEIAKKAAEARWKGKMQTGE